VSAARIAGVVLLACAGLVAVPAPAGAQVRATHEVRKGDTLFGVARKAKHEGVTRNQMILAIVRANPGAFPAGNIHIMVVGTVLNIPPREVVTAIDPAEADRRVGELLASKPAPAVAALRPAPVPKAPETVPPGLEAAARRYRDGLALERGGDDRGALTAFLEAGEGGYGPAQKRLGQIYDKGNSVVAHDYQASLKWYQKAREQGVQIDKPLQRTMPR
jgi:pilus assembly protein FimV